MNLIYVTILIAYIYTTACDEGNKVPPLTLEERSRNLPETGTALHNHSELHSFPSSSKIWIDKELTTLEEHNISSSRLGYSIRTKYPEIQEKVKGVFAHSPNRIFPPGKHIELNIRPQDSDNSKEQIDRILKRINSVYQWLNYPIIYPDDIEAWWQDTEWKEKEGMPYDRYSINALILKNGFTLFIFDRRPVLTEKDIRHW